MPTSSPASALAGLLRSCPRLSQVLAGVLVSGYVLQLFFSPAREYLAMVAGRCGVSFSLPCNRQTCAADRRKRDAVMYIAPRSNS